MTPSVGFTPKLGSSGLALTVTPTPSSTLVGKGSNGLRIVNESPVLSNVYFITYNSADGVPAVSPLYTGVPVCFSLSKANEVIIKKPREHDSIYIVATVEVGVFLQVGEV